MIPFDIDGISINCNISDIDSIIYTSNNEIKLYPYFINDKSSEIKCIAPSPLHGRSIIVDYNEENERFIITKGNGLTYFPYGFISTDELESYAWGLLRSEDAARDYNSCNYINKLGVLTNKMEAVYLLSKKELKVNNKKVLLNPTILQYSVKCPYRIADIPFLTKKTISFYTDKWKDYFKSEFNDKYLITASVLIKNLNLLHTSDVLHNSINSQNISLSLELLDFELTRTPNTPYDNILDEVEFRKLMKREIIYTLEIINQVAIYFKEKVEKKYLISILKENGFSYILL
jgi:hypothetical protein